MATAEGAPPGERAVTGAREVIGVGFFAYQDACDALFPKLYGFFFGQNKLS